MRQPCQSKSRARFRDRGNATSTLEPSNPGTRFETVLAAGMMPGHFLDRMESIVRTIPEKTNTWQRKRQHSNGNSESCCLLFLHSRKLILGCTSTNHL